MVGATWALSGLAVGRPDLDRLALSWLKLGQLDCLGWLGWLGCLDVTGLDLTGLDLTEHADGLDRNRLDRNRLDPNGRRDFDCRELRWVDGAYFGGGLEVVAVVLALVRARLDRPWLDRSWLDRSWLRTDRG